MSPGPPAAAKRASGGWPQGAFRHLRALQLKDRFKEIFINVW